jgi:hypothetical protein
MLAGLISLANCQSFNHSPINETIEATATIQSTSTRSAIPSLPTIIPTVGAIIDPTQAQLELLYTSSIKYLADTEEKSWQVAGSLGYAPLGGYPSNMCGPLAISILKDAGIISKVTNLHDFWLLNPEEDGELLVNAFPADHFEWMHNPLPIDKIDYGKVPLRAGDLVYIYSGTRGDFSHVLAVTRIDADGRAYSVTNNYTENGFVIQEFLLYDPTEPGTGVFYEWTNPANRKLGLTGFGGMNIWRPRQLPYYADGAP